MKINLVLEVPDDVVAQLMNSLADNAKLVGQSNAAPAEKPLTQGVVAGMGEQSTVMKPTAPPAGVLRMMKLAAHPWFQEWAAFIAPKPIVDAAAGDSLKLAQRLLGELVLKDKGFATWGTEQDVSLADVETNYRIWAMKKGYDLDE